MAAARDPAVFGWFLQLPGAPCASVVTVAECLHGVERDVSAARAAHRRAFFVATFDRMTLVPVDLAIAEEASRILAELSRAGTMIPPFDVLIAATARHHGWPLASADRHFERVEGLRVLAPT